MCLGLRGLDGSSYVFHFRTSVVLGCSSELSVDRDAGRWNVEQSEIERRRQAFWELYSYDFLQVCGLCLVAWSF